MGTILDLNKGTSHSYVDNPFWSIFQIRFKFILHQIQVNKCFEQMKIAELKRHRYPEEINQESQLLKDAKDEIEQDNILKQNMEDQGILFSNTEKGNVLLFNIMTFNDKYDAKNTQELKNMTYLSNKYKDQGLSQYGLFTYDVESGEKRSNKEIAYKLNKLGFVDNQGSFTNEGIKFLEKVDVNGKEMHDIFRFLKRNSPLFIPRYGMASHIYDIHTKFLLNRYGQVEHYYAPSVELAKIEADIKVLLIEEWEEKKWRDLIEPVDMFS